MLELKISKADFDKLSEDMQKLYKKDGDEYVLQVKGMDDPAELRRARDREKQRAEDEKKRAEDEKKRADDLQKKLDDEASGDARKKGDIEALEKSWQAKIDAAEKKGKEEADKLRDQLRVLLVENKARAIADEISTSPELLLPHIMSRLQADLDGEKPTTRVLDIDGKPSAATIEELQKEIVATTKFAPIIKASKATGGGAGSGGGNGGGGAPSDKKFGDLTERERIEFHTRDPEGFKKAAEAHKAELAKPKKP